MHCIHRVLHDEKKKKRQVQRYHKGIITKGLYVHLNNHGREGGRVKEI